MTEADKLLQKIDHIVVLMLENRSFDNLLGWLYDPDNRPPFDQVPRGQPYEGLSCRGLSNPIPRGNGRRTVPVGRAYRPNTPDVVPGEGFAHTNAQLYGELWPDRHNVPPELPEQAPMNGFVLDFIDSLRSRGLPARYRDYRQIMECYPPTMVPVISTLAHAYAVCDRWHCSVPSQTCPNRSFLMSGTSSGFVDNWPYTNWLENDVTTIFDRIEQAGRSDLSWHVYYDVADIVPLTWLIFPRLRRKLFSHFSTMEQFYSDAREGRLPSFCLVEPRYFFNRTSQHPPANVMPGEGLIRDVYNAVRASPNWPRTLLIITYDEHGGCYDHVPPPSALPPDPAAPRGQHGFRFDRLGLRVPTLLISPWVPAGTVFRAIGPDGTPRPFDHTSVIKTVTARWGLPSLTARDAAAEHVGAALSLPEIRTDLPSLPELQSEGTGVADWPPSGLLDAAVGLLAARMGVKAPEITCAAEAQDFLRQGLARVSHHLPDRT